MHVTSFSLRDFRKLLPALAVLLLLPACGRKMPAETSATEPAAERTSEAEMPRAAIAGDGISWQVLDLAGEENVRLKAQLSNWEQEEDDRRYATEHPMGNGKTVLTRYDEEQGFVRLYLRYDKTGKEVLLPLNEGEDLWGKQIHGPQAHVLDERYVLVQWAGYGGCGVFDTKEMKRVSFDQYVQDPCLITRDTLYMNKIPAIGLYAYDLNAMRRGEALEGRDVLAGIPHEDAFGFDWFPIVTEDERYYITTNGDLFIFDLEKKVLALFLPEASLGEGIKPYGIAARDAHTVYWYSDKHLIEITLT